MKILIDKETVELAIYALETVTKEMLALRDELAERGGRPKANEFHQRLWDSSHKAYVETAIPAAEALRQALEQSTEQEPVAWTLDILEQEIYEKTRQFVSLDVMELLLNLLNTSPPQPQKAAPRKPLTDEQADAAVDAWVEAYLAKASWRDRMRAAIEAAHGITGEKE